MGDTYTGRLVMVERANPTDRHSAYHDGQYLITRETDHQLYGMPMTGFDDGLTVYAVSGHTSKTALPLVGAAAYKVLAVEGAKPWVLQALDDVEEEIRRVRAGEEKPRWVDKVYDQAEDFLPRLRELIAQALLQGEPAEAPSGEAADWAVGAVRRLDGCEALGVAESATTTVVGEPMTLEWAAEAPAPPTVHVTAPRGTRVLVTHE